MLLVKTKIAPSSIHGIGLFADEAIIRGTPIWEFKEPFDTLWSQEYVYSLPDVAKVHVLKYCARLHNGLYLMTGDNDRFFNHSDTPNCSTDSEATKTVALTDIWPGDELTENYFSYCNDKSEVKCL